MILVQVYNWGSWWILAGNNSQHCHVWFRVREDTERRDRTFSPPPPSPTPVYLDYQTLPSPNLPCFKIQDGSQIFHKNTLSACYAKNTLPLQTPAQWINFSLCIRYLVYIIYINWATHSFSEGLCILLFLGNKEILNIKRKHLSTIMKPMNFTYIECYLAWFNDSGCIRKSVDK